MKHLHRSVALLLALLLVLPAFSTAAYAAGKYKKKTLQVGKWYKLPYYEFFDNLKTIYKLTLASDSIVTLNWKNKRLSDYTRVYFYTDAQCDHQVWYWNCTDNNLKPTRSGSKPVVLSKGVYYIKMCEVRKSTTKVMFTVEKVINKDNYCRAKAIFLKRNKKEKIIQTNDYCYVRWYKIKLDRKQAVTFTAVNEDGHYRTPILSIRDSKDNFVSYTKTEDPLIITTEPLKKGTYYLNVDIFRPFEEYVGYYVTLKWN